MSMRLFSKAKTKAPSCGSGGLCQALKKYALIAAGCIPFAIGVACFYEPSHLAPGGVSGIALMIHTAFPSLPVGALLFAINVPLLFIGAVRLGRRFLFDTLVAVGFSAVLTDLFSAYVNALTYDTLLAAVAGGALVAIGLGVVFRHGATTGGTDVAVKLMKLKIRHVNTGVIFLIFDGAVVLASWMLLGNVEAALYSAIALAVQTLVLDKILYGADGAMLVYIISAKSRHISERVRIELDAGATMLYGQGEHTGASREILLTVVRAAQLPPLRDVIKEEDAEAFVIVTRSIAVFGKGFKDHFVEEL